MRTIQSIYKKKKNVERRSMKTFSRNENSKSLVVKRQHCFINFLVSVAVVTAV